MRWEIERHPVVVIWRGVPIYGSIIQYVEFDTLPVAESVLERVLLAARGGDGDQLVPH